MEIYMIILLVIAIILFAFLFTFFFMSNLVFNKSFRRVDNTFDAYLGEKDGAYKEYKNIVATRIKDYLNKDYQDVTINSYDNTSLHGYFFPNKSKNVLIFVHGWYGNSLGDLVAINPYFYEEGYNVLAIDLRGHNKSGGKTIGFGVKDHFDLIKWVEYVNKLFNNDCNIVIHGVSMGANTTLLVADINMPNVKCLIADCGFANGFSQVKKSCKDFHLPAFPFAYTYDIVCFMKGHFSLRKYKTQESLKNSLYPVLFIHGDIDDFVLPNNSQMGFDNAKCYKEIKYFKGANHALSSLMYPNEYKLLIDSFVKKSFDISSK